MISTSSLEKERAYSAYLTGPKTYNVIDKDHKNNCKTKELKPIKQDDIVLELDK